MTTLKRILSLLSLLALAACGGGGGSAGTAPFGDGSGTTDGTGANGGTTAKPTLTVSISTTSVTSAAAATVTATVKDAGGAGVSGQVVSFTTAGTLGAFTPASALTDSSGVASVQLSPASASSNGADLAVAKVTVGTTALSGSVGFQIVATTIAPSGTPTISVALSTSSVSAALPALFTATIKDAAGSGMLGQVVKFSSVDGLGAFNPSSALTDANGSATVSLVPATSAANGADLAVAQATVNGTLLTKTSGFSVAAGAATSSGVPSISMALSSTTIRTSTPATATISVLDAAGVGLSGKVVSFSSPGGLGTFSPASALTDSSGRASVQLAPAASTTSGADLAVASVTVGSSTISVPVGFQVVPVNGPVGTPSISLALSDTTVTITSPVEVTAAVKDANGGAVVGQVVSFAGGSIGSFSPASALTDINGNATASLSPLAVTTTGAGQATASTTINGATLTTSKGFAVQITSADLALVLSSTQIPNTGSGAVTITATAIDSNRNTVAGVPITFTADAQAVIVGASAATGIDGTATATLTIGSDRANRLVNLTATTGSITRTATVQVVGTTITSTLVPAVVAPGGLGSVQYRVLDQAGNPMVGQAVQIIAAGVTPGQGTGSTGTNGDFIFSYTAPASPGSYAVTANVAGSTDTQTLQVQNAGVIPSVIGSIASASISANPSVVATNLAGSATNRSEIRALFLGANNLPLANVRARFDLNLDANSVGGTFTTGTTTLYSDANGVVTTAYVPGTRSSPTSGVTVRVCYGSSDTDPNLVNCVTTKLVTLTVTAEPLGVSIGTNETITVNDLTYTKQFIVSVADSAGVAKPDVNLAVSLDLPNYRKGYYVVSNNKWVKAGPLASGDFAVCLNEDANRNGVLETAEDNNSDGQLWPRKPDVIVSLLQSKTGADGTAVLQIQYAKDHGSWVDAFITVTASGVAGSEGRVSRLVAPVPVDAASIANITSDPAYKLSPYGQSSSCATPN